MTKLTDTSRMPFGKYRNEKMANVPAKKKTNKDFGWKEYSRKLILSPDPTQTNLF